MAYQITNIEMAQFPTETDVSEAMANVGLPKEHFEKAIERFVCDAPLINNQGYQQILAGKLENYLKKELLNSSGLILGSPDYSPRLKERADVVIQSRETGSKIYIEVEFRPNVEKDLIKFQIGYNSGRLTAAVLILAINRNNINSGYTTMPEFKKFSLVIKELKPSYPLLLIGIDGKHIRS